MERIEKLRIAILEEGMLPEYRDELGTLLERVKRQGQLAAQWEADIKAVWLDAYLRGEVYKTEEVNGVKIQCTDAGDPKTTVIEAHYVPNVEELEAAYPPHVAPQIWIHVPRSETTTPGKKAGVSVTLPKA